MFVGHYGVSYVAKRWRPELPLWVLFVAVQFVDVLWAVFVPLGIEHVRIVPGITATNPLDLYYMPYTHSLLAAVLWSVAAYAAYRMLRRGRPDVAGAAVVGVAVFSHWVLDFIVHRPDLPLYDNAYKVGLGLWNYRYPAFALELAILFGGMALYLRGTRGKGVLGRYGMPVLGVVMAGLQAVVFFGAPPSSAGSTAVTAIALYTTLTAAAFWLERRREPLPVGSV